MPVELDPLLAVSAVDGRYRDKTAPLAPICSEFGLIRWRVQTECAWFTALADSTAIAELPALTATQRAQVAAIHENFELADAQAIKTLEARTNHDVKAVEYFVKERLASIEGLQAHIEFVHFACTSEDINNVAYGLMLGQARSRVLLPAMAELRSAIDDLAQAHAAAPMLSRTHGQPASPTTLGKELTNVSRRLQRQQSQFADQPILAKFNGAVGNYNAHTAAYPGVDWPQLAGEFLQALGLQQNTHTTQIEPHDYLAELCHTLMRFNQILLDFNRDVWGYIAIEYFGQRAVEGETGSSTMPHKVNPIDFENSEGNLGLANALLAHMADKLPVSRWQRDLSDSTVQRTLGSALAYCLIAYRATLKGLSRLQVNPAHMAADLDANWEVLGEAVQTVMRRHGLAEPYERLKQATRGKRLDEHAYGELLDALEGELPAAALNELRTLRPESYIGIATELATNGEVS